MSPAMKLRLYELSWSCYELSPAMKLRPLRVELRLLRKVALYETLSVTSWVEAATNCRPLWNFVRYELSWGCYELSPAMKFRRLRVELRLLRIAARYEISSVTSWVEDVKNCRPLWNFVRYELSWGCYELLAAMKIRPLRVELRLLRIVARYETLSVTSWVEAVTNCRPLWNFVRYELSWGCYELLPAMKLRPLRVELRLLRIVAHYEFSFVTNWVEAVTKCRPLWNFVCMSWVEAVTNCRPLWNFVRYELSWGCYERSPSMKLCPLRVELRLLRIVARYEISSVTSCVEVVTIFRPLWNFVCMSWVEAVTNCRPLWNFVLYELSWGCYERSPSMKLCPLRVELRLLRIVARYETLSVTSWVEAVTNCRPLWNFVCYELSWGCYELLPAMKLRPLRVALRSLRFFARYETSSVWVELKLLRIVARYETSSLTSWVEAATNCNPLWNFVRYELSWGCYELSPAMKLRPLRVELRLSRIVACYETSSVTSCVEVVTIFRPLWNFVCMSWVKAVRNCRPLWNFVRYELSWGCYERSPSMKFCPLRVELRLLLIVARYETSSVTSWWGCYERSPSMKLCPLRVELRLLLIVACYETSSVTSCVEVVTIFRPLWNFFCMSWVEADKKCRQLWSFISHELSWGC